MKTPSAFVAYKRTNGHPVNASRRLSRTSDRLLCTNPIPCKDLCFLSWIEPLVVFLFHLKKYYIPQMLVYALKRLLQSPTLTLGRSLAWLGLLSIAIPHSSMT